MPVKDKSVYPPDWKQISARIRERAGHKCETCGVKNHSTIARFIDNPANYVYIDDEEAMYWNAEKLQEKTVLVVLTVAHLNHDTTDNRDCNLKALCQLCHNRLDAKMRAGHAKVTRGEKKHARIQANGQLTLLGDER